jgi:hypothetical protein
MRSSGVLKVWNNVYSLRAHNTAESLELSINFIEVIPILCILVAGILVSVTLLTAELCTKNTILSVKGCKRNCV